MQRILEINRYEPRCCPAARQPVCGCSAGFGITSRPETVVPEPEPWVALLPALDPTAKGWKHRDWYVGDAADQLFDRSGNIGPTVWCDGRIVGVWSFREGALVHLLLEDIGSEACARIDTEIDRLTTWCGHVRVTPKFRTPEERELANA